MSKISDRDFGSRSYPQSGDRDGGSRGYPQSGDRDGGSRYPQSGDRDGGSRGYPQSGDRDGGSRGYPGDRDGGSRGYPQSGDRDGGYRDGGYRGYPQSGDRDGGGSREGGWGRDRDNRSGGMGDEANNWRQSRDNSQNTGSGGSSFGQSSRSNYSRPPVEERPAHLKVNLLPKGATIPTDSVSSEPVAVAAADKPADKWSTVFSKREIPAVDSSSRQDARFERTNDDSARDGNYGRERRDFRDSDRGERGMGSYGERSGGGYRGGRNDNRDDSVVDDPRFAGKFGSSSAGGSSYSRGDARGSFGGRGGDGRSSGSYGRYEGGGGGRYEGGGGGRYEGGRYGDSRYGEHVKYDPSAPLPTAPRSQLSTSPQPVAIVASGPTSAKLKAVEDTKSAKAAKKLERQEADRKAKEAKEAAALAAAAALEQKKTAHAIALAAAVDALATGLKGSALLAHINGVDVKPSGAALLKEILSKYDINEVESSQWYKKDEYGEVLIDLLVGSVPAQVAALYSVQAYCHERKFPKLNVNGKERKLIELIFSLLISNGIVDPDGVLAWADDDNAAEVGGRVDAVVQTTSFVHSIRLLLLEEFDDEQEEEEIDAPRDFVR